MALLRSLLDLFSSVRLGITLMVLIFLYSAVGSAGLPVHWNVLRPDAWLPLREAFDLSEFRWFNWWPFALLIALFCVNLSVTTIRRIPFNRVNLGVWITYLYTLTRGHRFILILITSCTLTRDCWLLGSTCWFLSRC